MDEGREEGVRREREVRCGQREARSDAPEWLLRCSGEWSRERETRAGNGEEEVDEREVGSMRVRSSRAWRRLRWRSEGRCRAEEGAGVTLLSRLSLLPICTVLQTVTASSTRR